MNQQISIIGKKDDRRTNFLMYDPIQFTQKFHPKTPPKTASCIKDWIFTKGFTKSGFDRNNRLKNTTRRGGSLRDLTIFPDKKSRKIPFLE